MRETTVALETKDGSMDAFLVEPESKAKGPAVVVVPEAFGVNSHIKDVCRRFAKEGFVAIAPDIFHRSGKGLVFAYGDWGKIAPVFATLSNDTLETDIRACLEHARTLAGVDPRKVGVTGFCVGGLATFVAACRTDAASFVAFYGGGIVEARPGLALQPALPEAGKIRAPILLFFGSRDKHIPQSDVSAIGDELRSQGKVHGIKVYDADHGFFCEERASFEPGAAKDAWHRTLDWFKETLSGLEYRALGKNGLSVPLLGLGCMGMSEFYGKSDEKASVETIRRAIDLGVNFLDTADMYGPFKNEVLVGKAIADRREKVLLATKFGNMRGADGSFLGVNGKPDYVRKCCDASLERLGVDHIDLYYQHRVDPTVPIEETIGAMADLVAKGKVRFLGLSEAAPATIRALALEPRRRGGGAPRVPRARDRLRRLQPSRPRLPHRPLPEARGPPRGRLPEAEPALPGRELPEEPRPRRPDPRDREGEGRPPGTARARLGPRPGARRGRDPRDDDRPAPRGERRRDPDPPLARGPGADRRRLSPWRRLGGALPRAGHEGRQPLGRGPSSEEERRQLVAPVGSRLGVDVPQVEVDGHLGRAEPARDLAIAEALDRERRDLALARREAGAVRDGLEVLARSDRDHLDDREDLIRGGR
jgi:dienelactone hydrolase